MCLINGTTPTKCGSSAMLRACQHFALARLGRRRQSAGTQLETARWERDSISCSSQQLQSFCLREVSTSVRVRSTCQSGLTDPSPCNSGDCSFSYIDIHQVVLSSCLKGKVLYFLQAVLCIKNWTFFLNHWCLSWMLLSIWGCLPPSYFSHKS